MSWVITKSGLEVLRALHGSREVKRSRGFGWNAGDFGGKSAAATARVLERKGYVEVEHLSEVHKRYSITSSGEQLVRSIDAGRPWMVKRYRPRAANTQALASGDAQVASEVRQPFREGLKSGVSPTPKTAGGAET